MFGGGEDSDSDEQEEVDMLAGGMDMFGGGEDSDSDEQGGGGDSKNKIVSKYNTKLNFVELNKLQQSDGSFDIPHTMLAYQSPTEYSNTIAKSGVADAKIFNNIVMYGYLEKSSYVYIKEFKKLSNWFVRFYPDLTTEFIKSVFAIHIDYITYLDSQTINICCGGGGDY